MSATERLYLHRVQQASGSQVDLAASRGPGAEHVRSVAEEDGADGGRYAYIHVGQPGRLSRRQRAMRLPHAHT